MGSMGSIYAITNTVTGEKYIGQTTKSIELRFKGHQSNAKYPELSNKLYDSFNKYGMENFTLECLVEKAPIHELNRLEVYYMDLYDTCEHGLNTHRQGGGGSRGYHHTASARAKISTKSKENMWRINTPERTRKISEAQKGRKFTEEHKRNISSACQGKRLGEDNSFYGKEHTAKTKAIIGSKNRKYSIQQVNNEGVINNFPTIKSAVEFVLATGISKAKPSSVECNLYRACLGLQGSAYGYNWNYIEKCNDYPDRE